MPLIKLKEDVYIILKDVCRRRGYKISGLAERFIMEGIEREKIRVVEINEPA